MSQRSLASADRESIHKFLAKYADGRYADSAVERDFESASYVILLPRSATDATDRAVSMLERRIDRDLGLTVKVKRLIGESNDALSATLVNVLAKYIPKGLADVILATDGNACDVVIVMESAKAMPEDPDRQKIKRRLQKVLEAVEFTLSTVLYAPLRDDTPSEYQIIHQVSKHAPICADELAHKLTELKLHFPSIRWLKLQLDKLTRRGFLSFQPQHGFTLTETGLQTLPRLEHRNSPDIQRALALARRDWL